MDEKEQEPAVGQEKPTEEDNGSGLNKKVEIEPFEGRKQWLGGYKHKKNNTGEVF